MHQQYGIMENGNITNSKNINNKKTVIERCFTAVLWQFWQVFLSNGFNTKGVNEPMTSAEELPHPPRVVYTF